MRISASCRMVSRAAVPPLLVLLGLEEGWLGILGAAGMPCLMIIVSSVLLIFARKTFPNLPWARGCRI